MPNSTANNICLPTDQWVGYTIVVPCGARRGMDAGPVEPKIRDCNISRSERVEPRPLSAPQSQMIQIRWVVSFAPVVRFTRWVPYLVAKSVDVLVFLGGVTLAPLNPQEKILGQTPKWVAGPCGAHVDGQWNPSWNPLCRVQGPAPIGAKWAGPDRCRVPTKVCLYLPTSVKLRCSCGCSVVTSRDQEYQLCRDR